MSIETVNMATSMAPVSPEEFQAIAGGFMSLPYVSQGSIAVAIGLFMVLSTILRFFFKRWMMKSDILYREKVMEGLRHKNRLREQDDDEMVNHQL